MIGIRKQGSNDNFFVPARDLARCLPSIINSTVFMCEDAADENFEEFEAMEIKDDLNSIQIYLADAYDKGRKNNKEGLKSLKDLMGDLKTQESTAGSLFTYYFMYNTLMHLFTAPDMMLETPGELTKGDMLMSTLAGIINLMEPEDRRRIKQVLKEFVPKDFNEAVPECALIGERVAQVLHKEDK